MKPLFALGCLFFLTGWVGSGITGNDGGGIIPCISHEGHLTVARLWHPAWSIRGPSASLSDADGPFNERLAAACRHLGAPLPAVNRTQDTSSGRVVIRHTISCTTHGRDS